MFERDNDKSDSGRWIKAVAVAATAVAVASLAIVGTVAAQTRQTFNDVPRSHYAYDAVEWAYANRITEGCDNRFNFCPDKPLSRAHMVTFLKRYHDRFGSSASVPPATTTTAATPDRWVLTGFGTTRYADAITLPAGHYLVDFVLVLRSTETDPITKVEVKAGGPETTSERILFTLARDQNTLDVTENNDVHTVRHRHSLEIRSGLGRLSPGRIYFTVIVTPATNVNIATAEWEIRVTER